MRRRADDDGNLMLLAGIIVTIAFILTALTLEQVGSLERAAATETPTTISGEWRFLHERLAENLNTSVTPDLSLASFKDTTLPALVSTFRTIESEKGYDITLRLAEDPTKVNKTEADLLSGGRYANGPGGKLYSIDATKDFSTIVADDALDGVIMHTPCDDPTAARCIQGILLAVHMSDGQSSLDEVMLFYVNRP